jgi:branched-chain amino acid transport system permease protein
VIARLTRPGRAAGGRPSRGLVRRTQDRLRLSPSRSQRLFLLLLAVLWILAPSYVSDYWLDVLARCGLAAIGAIGLNLLTGYTGQISLGQAFFIGVGAYVAAWFGVQQQMPLLVWLPLCAIIGGLIGGLIGPFALRLRGNYLAIVTIGLLYIGNLIFNNWDSLTGGHAGTATAAPVSIGPLDFADLHLFGQVWSRRQGLFWLVWLIVALTALLAKNLVRTRPGRAMQAVRDQDVAAEIVGVNVARYKVGAFVVSSALAAVAGGLFGVVQQFVNPGDFGGAPGLLLSITYVAMIIVGGMGTIGGSVVGALVVVGLPNVIQQANQSIAIPLVKSSPTATDGIVTVFQLNQLLYGLLIVLFLLFESRGLAAVWQRAKAFVTSWPFPS